MIDDTTRAFLRPEGRVVLDAAVFPAADRRAVQQHRTARASMAVTDAQATCFYHSTLQAESVCEDCGCYVCAMCALPIGGRTVCPSCVVNSRKNNGGWSGFVESRPLWGARACGIALLSLVFPLLWFVLPLVSVGVLIMVWKCWGKPGSLVRPGKGGLIWAAVLAAVGMAAGLAFWWLMAGEALTDSQ